MPNIVKLDDRALIAIGGEEATSLLQGIVTCNVEDMGEGSIVFGALLTPQGKILFDFFIQRQVDGFTIDIEQSVRADFIKRLMFYRLRAAVTIEAIDDDNSVFAMWDNAGEPDDNWHIDPRSGEMGWRSIGNNIKTNATLTDYHSHRISTGMPQSGLDFELSAAFPHDVFMDLFGDKNSGVDFTKGCYVGQEVVSRMQHRGTARRRVVMVSGTSPLPTSGSIMAGEKSIGELASVAGNKALASVRVDRVAAALSADIPLTIEGQQITLSIPSWADLNWPDA